MSFFPKDEYVARRGVAMKIVEPNPNVRVGAQRDHKVDKEAAKFQEKEFILSKAMTDKAPKASKVKTFNSDDIPWAVGNGNVIAPPKPDASRYQRIIGLRVPDELMSKYYHGDALERERRAEQDKMEHARNFQDNFSPQKPDRLHKFMPRTLDPPPGQKLVPINGFRGLGEYHRDRPIGKGHVPESTFDPLGMRSWAPRITGLKRLPQSNMTSLPDGSLKYDDGVAFETTQKRAFPAPHRHRFDQNYGPEHDISGFRALGASDVPNGPRGRKHEPGQYVDRHYTNVVPASNGNAASPSYRSASSLGMASPMHSYTDNGRVSAPPASHLMYHPVVN